MPPFVAWTFSLAWLLFWSLFVHAAWRGIRMARASSAWHPVPGRTIAARIDSRIEPTGGSRGSRRAYRFRVRYGYEAGGVPLQGTALHATEAADLTSWGGERSAQALLKRHPAGSEQVVYHDPADPSRAALAVGVRGRDWLFLAISMLLCMLSPGLLWFCLVLLAPANLR